MAKTKTLFACQSCGYESPRWLGKCPDCEQWNSFVEEQTAPAGTVQASRAQLVSSSTEAVRLSEIDTVEDQRYPTGMDELDRVLGGGVVRDSVSLIGGDPGIGKSTLSLQIAAKMSQQGHKVLYISGEESIKQGHMRASRLGVLDAEHLFLVNQIELSQIESLIKEIEPAIVIVDSVQVIFHQDITSAPGSVSQVRECASALTHLAKRKGFALFLIGHVTKDGQLAGPRVLEHIVDTVLYFEGERYSTFRILRGIKNRFGSTNEIGVFEMTAQGLQQVINPSEIFLSERPQNASGSVVVPLMEGTRPFLIEIQGLVCRSSYGVVRQKAQGFDQNRLALLSAVLEKRIGLQIQDQDIFVNVVGGVKAMDPAVDLAVCVAMASAFYDRPVSFSTVVIGEVGLSAEIRSVSQIASRISEADKLGFKRAIVPANNLKALKDVNQKSIELIPVAHLKETLEILSETT